MALNGKSFSGIAKDDEFKTDCLKEDGKTADSLNSEMLNIEIFESRPPKLMERFFMYEEEGLREVSMEMLFEERLVSENEIIS